LAAVRLRTLTEAECYTRCYGTRDDRVSVLRDPSESTLPAARFERSLRELVEGRLAELEPTEQEAA
jgi:hypothetical protein